jgi:flagellar biosynthesis GTPase FlhF
MPAALTCCVHRPLGLCPWSAPPSAKPLYKCCWAVVTGPHAVCMRPDVLNHLHLISSLPPGVHLEVTTSRSLEPAAPHQIASSPTPTVCLDCWLPNDAAPDRREPATSRSSRLALERELVAALAQVGGAGCSEEGGADTRSLCASLDHRGHANCWVQLLSVALLSCTMCAFRDAQHSTAQHSTAQHSTAQHSTAQHSTAQHTTAQHSTQHSTAQHTAQHSTAQHSTAQHSTAQHSTAQHRQAGADVLAWWCMQHA